MSSTGKSGPNIGSSFQDQDFLDFSQSLAITISISSAATNYYMDNKSLYSIIQNQSYYRIFFQALREDTNIQTVMLTLIDLQKKVNFKISYTFYQYKIQMSKTIEDYRQIVKVLKLQLLKVREENNSLSKTLGISTESESTSYTPRLEKLKNCNQQFAKFLLLYNQFAHRCELIGVTPEMVFRIADKKRDKKVASSDFMEIMKRLKLKMTEVDIQRLLQPMAKSNNIHYDQYLQYISAFQINSQTYPQRSQRTFSQICLLKFGQWAKQKQKSVQILFREISNKEGKPTISFKSFSQYCKSNTALKDSEIISIFVTLDAFSDCQIDRDAFIRQMNKIAYLVDKGVNLDEERDQKASSDNRGRKNNRQNNRQESRQDDEDYKMEIDTGVEKGAQVNKKQAKKQMKLTKGDLTKLIQQMKNQGISSNNFISKLLEKQDQRKLIRPFSINDFAKVIQSISKGADKKKIINYFKCLDTSYNGSVSTDELIKLWLEGRQISDSAEVLYKLLARHFKEIQAQQYITKFNTAGYQKNDVINLSMIQDVLQGMDLREQYLQLVQKIIPSKCTVQKFIELLQTGGVPKPDKPFKPMKKADFQNMNVAIKKLISKQSKRFPKLLRQEDPQKKEWETIFTDQWTCWNYCLQTASKLTTHWRDPQFGPNKGDPHGYRSIVGNQSQVPQGIPMEDQILWMTFEQMFDKESKPKDKIQLFSDNLTSNDIVQGNIGNCWFVSSLSIVTSYDPFIKGQSLEKCKKNPQLLTFGVHPIIFHFFRQYGLYVFKFFKAFQPVYVVVDALFPVNQSNNELIFGKSPDQGLQWVAFVQKAYAKLHHCYSNLISGDISQGLSDLTNTLPIKQTISNTNPEELLQKILKLVSQNQLMGCSINLPPKTKSEAPVKLNEQRTGLFYGHAYSISDFVDFSKINKEDFKLMRIRNPWGHGQWSLDWSDKPLNDDPEYKKLDKFLPEINKYYDQKIKIAKKNREDVEIVKYEKRQDGEFFMNFYDFAQIFSNLFTGYSLKGKDFTCYSLQGKWDKATPSGLCKVKGSSDAQRTKFVKDNYQFIMEVKQKTQIIMFLIQQDGRLFRGQKYPYKEICNGIIILSFNLDPKQNLLEKFDPAKMTTSSLKLQLKRQTNYWHKFQPGRYAIFPCKTANDIPETKFDFRVYAQKRIDIRKIKGASGTDFKILAKQGKQDLPPVTSLNPIIDIVQRSSKQK